MSGVQILDVVLLATDDVDEWLRRWRAEYLPGAVGRGMAEERLWRAWTGPDTVAVRILWSLPDSGAFFAARAAAGAASQAAPRSPSARRGPPHPPPAAAVPARVAPRR
ncbi:hypothetical protein ACWCRC_43740, partial [Streptomyces sp. NPDC001940]